jgi:hypothetical protein
MPQKLEHYQRQIKTRNSKATSQANQPTSATVKYCSSTTIKPSSSATVKPSSSATVKQTISLIEMMKAAGMQVAPAKKKARLN